MNNLQVCIDQSNESTSPTALLPEK